MSALCGSVLFLLLHIAFKAVVINGSLQPEQLETQKPKQWGLLVAGSNGYDNYRHQADVCHAYQVLHRHGIPDDRIVVMMYDDIANNSENPTKGEIINRPNGTNVYERVPKDYTGEFVTPENFLKVLQGKEPGVGTNKVIASGQYDHVFVYFSDHGAPGLLIFPDSHLHARHLINVIIKMHAEKKYGKLVFFVEACYSGSMFETLLPKNISVYAMTAAHAQELSYACYYDTFRGTWLGDRFSVNWMEFADQKDLHKETLGATYKTVKEETTTSHVMEYGDMTTTNLKLSEFMGDNITAPLFLKNFSCGPVDGADPTIGVLKYRINTTTDETLRHELEHNKTEILNSRDNLTMVFINITHKLGAGEEAITTKLPLTNFECYEKAVDVFSEKCLNLPKNPFSATLYYILVNLCGGNNSTEAIVGAITTVCADLEIKDVI